MGPSNSSGGNVNQTDINVCDSDNVNCSQSINNGNTAGGAASASNSFGLSASFSPVPELQQLAAQYNIKAVLLIWSLYFVNKELNT